jgi:hypothetical protein
MRPPFDNSRCHRRHQGPGGRRTGGARLAEEAQGFEELIQIMK